MSLTTPPARRSSRTDRPFNSNRRHDDFARDAVFAEFRGRDARAIDQGDFEDRRPHEFARPLAAGGRKPALAAAPRLSVT